MSKYNPTTCPKLLIEVFENGDDIAAFCAKNKMGRSTFFEWTKKHKEFADAYEIARELGQAWWEDFGKNGIKADKFNATVWCMIMRNRFRYTSERTVQLAGLAKAKDFNAKMKVLEKEIEGGSLTPAEATALASVVSAGVAINEKTSLVDQVKELMKLAAKK